MPEPLHDRPVWYRSLYWRIALGFIACVAAVLLAQAALFLWLSTRDNPALIRAPQSLAAVAASDIASALEADRALDVGSFVAREYGRARHGLLVVMADGRVFANRTFRYPPVLLRVAQARLRRELREDRAVEGGAGEDGDTAPIAGALPRTEGPRRGGTPRSRGSMRPAFGQIVVDGSLVGLTVAVPGRPGVPILAEYGVTLAVAGVVLLLAGTATMSFFVFRPVRKRLRALEAAAAAVGAGQTSARAPEDGGDEVAALARRFNRMAADLEARVRELQQADESRRQLLADVSHELMTPLTAIRGYLETLSLPRAVPDEGTRERYLRIVTEETLRLEAIIGDLLELARLESGGGDLRRERVPVSHLFGRAVDRHETRTVERDLTLETSIAPGADVVVGDERRLEQAVQNLVANAIRHTPPGGRIRLEARPAAGAVEIIVSDTGPGIPPEHLERIFDRFYRVDAARDPRTGGSGLGLSIVRAVVERHGGTISATNGPEGGARFVIRLPGGGTNGRDFDGANFAIIDPGDTSG